MMADSSMQGAGQHGNAQQGAAHDAAHGAAYGAAANATRSDERRARRRDRRRIPGAGRRLRQLPPWQRVATVVGRDLLMVVGTLAAMWTSIHFSQPVFSGQAPLMSAITGRAPVAPVDSTPLERLVATEQFELDRRAFAADLVRTGQVEPARADSIAFYAVREAYVREIPPALVFGVMLTENARFISHAMSNVGAVGLMQIYPKVWLKPLGDRFGRDLASDSTNVKYGVYILSEYIKVTGDTVRSPELNRGLLRYNGCVRGANTPNCHTYPAKVRRYVERSAQAICADRSFDDCIARPFIAGLRGEQLDTSPAE
jgi:hypothetical protein